MKFGTKTCRGGGEGNVHTNKQMKELGGGTYIQTNKLGGRGRTHERTNKQTYLFLHLKPDTG